jgi:hypothetical protein
VVSITSEETSTSIHFTSTSRKGGSDLHFCGVDYLGGDIDLDPFHVDYSVGDIDVKIETCTRSGAEA